MYSLQIPAWQPASYFFYPSGYNGTSAGHHPIVDLTIGQKMKVVFVSMNVSGIE
jgi:hypothetical protein